jgi:hypothetical protein
MGNAMNKKHLTTFFSLTYSALLLITVSMGYQTPALAASTDQADNTTDARTLIRLSASERALVLEEMRSFLNSVQQITQGLAEDDMQIVVQAARHSGKAAQSQVPDSLKKKLPMQFKKQGGDTHMKFDQLALDAGDLGDTEHTLKQLSTLMKNCVACHAVYRIETQN